MSALTYPGQQFCRVFTGEGASQTDISCDVVSDVLIEHGRKAGEFGRAAVSSAEFTVRVERGGPNYRALGGVGKPVRIETGLGPGPFSDEWDMTGFGDPVGVWGTRFRGHISDVVCEWEQLGDGSWWMMYRVTCVGQLARLGSRLLPEAWINWEMQASRTRAQSILSVTVSGGFAVQNGDFYPTLVAGEIDRTRSALSHLEEMTVPAETILFDTPGGQVVWQEMSARKALPIVDLPCDAVKFAPGFMSLNDIVNQMHVSYGNVEPLPEVSSVDAASQAEFGIYAEREEYPYFASADAQLKADRVVRRQSKPTVVMPTVTVLLNQLDQTTMDQVMQLMVGHKVRMPALPDPYPVGNPGQFGGVWVVEGWTERVGSRTNPTAEWTLDLHLTSPLWSVISPTWAEATDTWATTVGTWDDEIGSL